MYILEPTFEDTTFASKEWPFKKGGLSSGVEINTFMFWFTLSSGLSRGGCPLSGCPLKRGSTGFFILNLLIKSKVGNLCNCAVLPSFDKLNNQSWLVAPCFLYTANTHLFCLWQHRHSDTLLGCQTCWRFLDSHHRRNGDRIRRLDCNTSAPVGRDMGRDLWPQHKGQMLIQKQSHQRNQIDWSAKWVVIVIFKKIYLKRNQSYLRVGVCRPCDMIELTTTSCNFSLCRRVEKVCVDQQLLRYSWSWS